MESHRFTCTSTRLQNKNSKLSEHFLADRLGSFFGQDDTRFKLKVPEFAKHDSGALFFASAMRYIESGKENARMSLEV